MAPKTTVFNYELLYLHEIQLILKYDEKGESKTGIIKIKFNYNIGDDTLDYGGIDYSDYSIQNYIKGNLLFLVRLIFKRIMN